MAWSPDSTKLASCGVDASVRVWDAASGNELVTCNLHAVPVFRLAWDAKGQRIASVGYDGTTHVWDPSTGRGQQTLHFDQAGLASIAWHPLNDRLAVAIGSQIRVWNATTGELTETLGGFADEIHSVAWHPDGERLASSGSHGRFAILRAGHSMPVQTFNGREGDWRSRVAWSPDGRFLATADRQDAIRIHNADTFAVIVTLQGHPGMQSSLSWSPDSRQLASSSWDGSVRIWPVGDGHSERNIVTESESIQAASWNPDGRRIVTGDNKGRVQVWDAQTRKRVLELTDPEGSLVHVSAVVFSRMARRSPPEAACRMRSCCGTPDQRSQSSVCRGRRSEDHPETAMSGHCAGIQRATFSRQVITHRDWYIWKTPFGSILRRHRSSIERLSWWIHAESTIARWYRPATGRMPFNGSTALRRRPRAGTLQQTIVTAGRQVGLPSRPTGVSIRDLRGRNPDVKSGCE